MTHAPVHITGVGAYTCAGKTAEELWQSALAGRSGLRGGIGRIDSAEAPDSNCRDIENTARGSFFAVTAAREAMREAGWTDFQDGDGLIYATTTGRIPHWERELVDHLNGVLTPEEFARYFQSQTLSTSLDAVTDALGFTGRRLLVTSACSAATQALAFGSMWIRQGVAKRVLIIGSEVLCRLTLEGFKSLQLLSTEGARPFDQNRSGINLSEGAGAICLANAVPGSEGVCISGYGLTTDGYHMTSPHADGRGSYQAMRKALESAGLKPRDISWVHAHGTGSTQNDSAEGAAISHLFSEVAEAPFVTSTKRIHGHALGASGVIESVLCVKAMRANTALPTAGLREADATISVRHPKSAEAYPLNHVLKNTLGFGGANASLVFSKFSILRHEGRA